MLDAVHVHAHGDVRGPVGHVRAVTNLDRQRVQIVHPADSLRLFAQKADPGKFMTWNHCQPIGWRSPSTRTRPPNCPRVQAAITTLAQASGLPFTYVGLSTFLPTSTDRVSDEPGVKVVFTFAARGHHLLPVGALGIGGRTSIGLPSGDWTVAGYVVMDTPG